MSEYVCRSCVTEYRKAEKRMVKHNALLTRTKYDRKESRIDAYTDCSVLYVLYVLIHFGGGGCELDV